MIKTILSIEKLEKTYITKNQKYHVLKQIDFNVNKGDFVSIMGQSGSGKTTLLNIISGFIKPDNGNVILSGKSITSIYESEMALVRQKNLGFVFQDFLLLDSLTIEENIYLPQIIAKKQQDKMIKTTENLLNYFAIDELAKKYPNEISGGEKQRTSVARALSNSPQLILADEPTGNLDTKSSNSVMKAFLLAKQNLNATILMVTHDPLIASYCDRVIFLSDGKILNEIYNTGNKKAFKDEIIYKLAEVIS